MLRRRAVRDLLLEEVAGVRHPGPDDEASLPLAEREELERELEGERLDDLEKAERRSLLVALLDWAAIVVLFLFREDAVPFMPIEGGIEDVLSFGLLAVATHSGLRLGDYGRYRAVRRALDRLG